MIDSCIYKENQRWVLVVIVVSFVEIYFPDLPFFDPKTTPSTKLNVWVGFIVYIVGVSVSETHMRVRTSIVVCLIMNVEIVSTSKCCAVLISIIAENSILGIFCDCELVIVGQWKNKTAFLIICSWYPLVTFWPFELCKSSNYFAIFSLRYR